MSSTAAVKVYTWTVCPYCDRAKNLLKSKGIAYEEINVDNDAALKALRDRTGMRTVPQIFIGEKLVGGYTELAALNAQGGLDKLLGR